MKLRSVVWLNPVTHSPNDSALLPHKLHSSINIRKNILYSWRLPASGYEDAYLSSREKNHLCTNWSPPSPARICNFLESISTGELILLHV